MSLTNSLYLVRKGKDLQDTLREKRIQIIPPAVSAWMPPIFTSEPFIVPRGRFASPLDLEGLPIKVRIRETGETVQVYPEFRILGVEEEDGGKLLATAVYHRYNEQIPALRERLDGIFRAHLGMQPEADDLEHIARSSFEASKPLCRRIASELGLLVEWLLEPDPATATWLTDLTAATPTSRTLTFNDELPTTEFNLTFTVTIERANLAHVHRVQRRARQKTSPADEISHLFRRIHQISNPAFKSIWTGINVWNSDIIRELAMDGFAKVVTRRIAQEFGYRVKFSDFTPEPNKAALDALKQVSPQAALHEIFEGQQNLYLALHRKRQEALVNSEGNFDEVKDLDERIARAKTEMESSRHERLKGNQEEIRLLESVKDVVSEDLRSKFNDALRLEENGKDSDARYRPR